MTKRILAIAFIFICTSVAWVVLGATIFNRTQSSDQRLRGRVGSTWGTSQAQQAPVAYTERIETRVAEAPVPRRSPAGTETTSTARPDRFRNRPRQSSTVHRADRRGLP